jgi:mannose-6-phosphate isomerase-like protein (cupin superfamily)|tara:strand:- start:442 stop:840 length:399 start_codon:yes stop_codon:yes gene_type:complete
MHIEHIEHDGTKLALIVRKDFQASGIEFFTPNTYTLQLGYMNRPAGYSIEPHLHNSVSREVTHTNEVLFVKSGKVKITFYNNDKEFVRDVVLVGGDVILLIEGGHGFEMLEPTEMLEVKQGPYVGEKDKTRF